MKREEWFVDLMGRYLQGALDRRSLDQAIGREQPTRGLHDQEKSLLRSCEWALRHMQDAAGCTSNRELRYHWRCLRGEIRFDPDERNRVRYLPPVPLRVPLSRGIFARLHDHAGFWGILLEPGERSGLRRLEILESDPALQGILRWHKIRVSSVGTKPYYLAEKRRVKKFLRELCLIIETCDSAAP